MSNLHAAITEEKLTEAYRLLLEMRDNCVKHADDQYDDPKREAKYEALNIAMDALGRSITPRWISVEERLPEEGQKVAFIPSCNHGSVYVGVLSQIGKSGGVMFSHREGCYKSNYYAKYWMPLSQPPKD